MSRDRSYPITCAASSQQLGLVFEAEVSTSDRTQEIKLVPTDESWQGGIMHECTRYLKSFITYHRNDGCTSTNLRGPIN